MGDTLFSLADYQKAIDCYEKSLKISTEIGERSGIARSNGSLGKAYRGLGEYQKAMDYTKKGLQISTEIGNLSGMAINNRILGNVHLSLKNYQEAMYHYEAALQISTNIGDRSEIATNNGNLGNAYHRLGEYQKAVDFSTKGLQISTEITYRSGIASNNANLGDAYLSLGEYEKVIEYTKESLKINAEIGDRSGIASSSSNLGKAYGGLGKYQKAIPFYEKSLQVSLEICDLSGITNSYSNLGKCFIEEGRYDEALYYYQQALKSIKDQSVPKHIDTAACYDDLGAVYIRLREQDKAAVCYKKALEIRQDNFEDKHDDAAVSYKKLMSVYRGKDEVEEGRADNQMAMEIQKKQLSSEPYDHEDLAQNKDFDCKNSNPIVKARSLALRFTDINPLCVRAIPYENPNKAAQQKSYIMSLYVDNGSNGVPEDIKKAANDMFADYEIEYVDLQRRPIPQIVTHLPASKKVNEKDLRDLSTMIEKNLHIFENRLNVTAVQASYKIVHSNKRDIPCVTVFVLGKGNIPVGETDLKKLDENPFDVDLDVVEGYFQPCSNNSGSYAFPLLGGVGIGIDPSEDACHVGTLGGFLEDENGKRYLLSCEHVLNPGEIVNPDIKIVQPAEIDYKIALKNVSSTVDELTNTLKKQKARMGEMESTDQDYGRYERRATKTQKALEKWTEEKSEVENSKPRSIGKYYHG